MLYSNVHMFSQFRILRSGILVILLCLTLHLQNGTVKGAATRKFQDISSPIEKLCSRRCESEACSGEALYFLSNMNQDVDPCDNFYTFVCGNFIKETNIPDASNIIDTFSIAQTIISTEMFSEVIAEIEPTELDAFKKTKTYYRNCMNESRIEDEGIKPLLDILDRISGFPVLVGAKWDENTFDWINTIFKIREQNFILSFPVISTITIDFKNTTKTTIKIQSAETAISKSFLIDARNNSLLKSYYDYMINVTVALGANRSAALDEMKKVLDFEVNLFNIKTPAEVLLDVSESSNQMTVQMLSQKYPSIPWLRLLNKIFNPSGITINNNETVYVADLKFITEIEKLIKDTPKRILANYLAWNMIQKVLMYMPKKLRSLSTNFVNIEQGTKRVMNRESWCLNEIMEGFPISLSAMYIKKFSNKKIKSNISEIAQNIKNQIKSNLEKLDWMDTETRKAALEKLETMSVLIGSVEELNDDRKINEHYSELQITPGSYLESAFNLTLFLEAKNYRALRNSMDNKLWEWTRNAAIVNTYYILQKNSIEISAGFLRSFYRLERPEYLNYGIVGTMLGHEIIHGFDNQGRKYDRDGNQKNWWQPDTEKQFFEKAKCIIDQYNNFTVEEIGLTVNGIITQGENIADNGGFKAAYHAYKDWAYRNNVTEPCLPFLDYTPQQMFWISAASNWCSKQRPEYLRHMISEDEHSPGNARIIISFSNIEEFARDFNCKIGSKMNPEKKCIIW